MKRFVVGDLHGAHKALLQCLKRSKFDSEKDQPQLLAIGSCAGSLSAHPWAALEA